MGAFKRVVLLHCNLILQTPTLPQHICIRKLWEEKNLSFVAWEFCSQIYRINALLISGFVLALTLIPVDFTKAKISLLVSQNLSCVLSEREWRWERISSWHRFLFHSSKKTPTLSDHLGSLSRKKSFLVIAVEFAATKDEVDEVLFTVFSCLLLR